MSTLEPARPDATPLRRFHDLYRGEFAFVWSAAQHLGVAPGAVADVVQDVFLTAYRRLDHLRFEVSPRAWLFGVTRRVASRYRRGAARLARRHAAFAELARPSSRAPQQNHDDAEQPEECTGVFDPVPGDILGPRLHNLDLGPRQRRHRRRLDRRHLDRRHLDRRRRLDHGRRDGSDDPQRDHLGPMRGVFDALATTPAAGVSGDLRGAVEHAHEGLVAAHRELSLIHISEPTRPY